MIRRRNGGFFKEVFSLNLDQRKKLFYLVCVPVRIIIGYLFFKYRNSLALSYIAAIWGAAWTWFMVHMRRWEDRPDVPPWYNGIGRVFWRFGISLMLLSFGFVGICSTEKERNDALLIVGIVIWADVAQGIADQIYFYNL
jgi:hypothetical protein